MTINYDITELTAIQKLNVPGSGLIVSNTAVGTGAFAVNTTGDNNVSIGNLASGSNTTGSTNTHVGFRAGYSNGTSNYNTAVGGNALYNNTNVANTAFGYGSGYGVVSGYSNVSMGFESYHSNPSGCRNVSIGNQSMFLAPSGSDGVAIGHWACRATVGNGNVGVGSLSLHQDVGAGSNTALGFNTLPNQSTGYNNTAVGTNAGGYITVGTQNTFLGSNSGLYDTGGGNLTSPSNVTCVGYDSRVSASNQVQLGNSSTTTYAYGAVQNRSDIRDKADVVDTSLGLDFVMGLRAVEGKWDFRQDYPGGIRDGSKKRKRTHQWFIAQEVKALAETLGVDFGGLQDHAINGGDDVMSLGYDEFIPPVVKALQEIKNRQDDIFRRLSALESSI